MTFMGPTRSVSGLFSALGFIVLSVGKGESRQKNKRRRIGGKKIIENEWKEGQKKK